jgi:3-deoxy-D-manno-octulosonic acid kinase
MHKKFLIPPFYVMIQRGKISFLLREEYRGLLLQQGIEDLETFLKKYGQTSPRLEGRTPLLSILLKDGTKTVVRSYSHGGLLRGLTRNLYLSGSRSFEELVLTEQIRSSGIPTVRPVGAVHRRIFPFFYRAYFISLEIPEAEDLPRYLLRTGSHPSPENLVEKRKTIHSVGRLIRQFHRAGFYHSDLQLKNILIAEGGPLLIDFDRCYRKKVLALRERTRNILRLNRSAEKWKRAGIPLSKTDRLRFLSAYAEGDREVKESLKKALRFHAFWFFIHRWI